jgi:hypothetical protein
MMEKITGTALDIVTYLMGDGVDKKALYDLELHQEKKKRTLSQNAYYWKLLEQIAVESHVSKAEIHNTNLRHLGLVLRISDKPVYILLPDTEKAEKEALNAITYHLAPRRETKLGTDGKIYRWYVMLRGSSEMDVHEMSALVDLAVQDAKAHGIETLTPAELEHMRQLELEQEKRRKTQ